MKNKKINIKGAENAFCQVGYEEYISLTNIARHKDDVNMDDIIKNWLSNRNSIELLGFWQLLHIPDFKPVEFDGFKILRPFLLLQIVIRANEIFG